jgi:hypothetical protein
LILVRVVCSCLILGLENLPRRAGLLSRPPPSGLANVGLQAATTAAIAAPVPAAIANRSDEDLRNQGRTTAASSQVVATKTRPASKAASVHRQIRRASPGEPGALVEDCESSALKMVSLLGLMWATGDSCGSGLPGVAPGAGFDSCLSLAPLIPGAGLAPFVSSFTLLTPSLAGRFIVATGCLHHAFLSVNSDAVRSDALI